MRRLAAVLVLVLAASLPASAGPGDLLTLAGGFLGDGGPAALAVLRGAEGLAQDTSGNVFVADRAGRRVRRIDAGGTITTFAGTGADGGSSGSGDGGLATAATFVSPRDVAVGANGDVFIADVDSNGVTGRVRRVDASTGVVSLFAGGGQTANAASIVPLEAGPATASSMRPEGLAIGPSGDVFVSDTLYHRVRRIDPATGLMTVVASVGRYTGAGGFEGDGGPAAAAKLSFPMGLASFQGALYVADFGNHRIRRIDFSQTVPTISTFAGDGTNCGPVSDGQAATASSMCSPRGLSVDAAGNVLVTEGSAAAGWRLRRIDATVGTISTVAVLPGATDVIARPGGALVSGGKHVRFVDSGGSASLFAGAGTAGGDGGPATAASLSMPIGVAVSASGDVYVADNDNARVRKIAAGSGIISTVAGNGTCPHSGDGGPATAAGICRVTNLAFDAAGNLYLAGSLYIRKVDAGTGIISTVGGTGAYPFPATPLGEGDPATSVAMYPSGLAIDAAGNVYFADRFRRLVRRIDAATSAVTTVAGTGEVGYNGDGISALSANIYPDDVTLFGGALFIADSLAGRVRRVDPVTGIITTIAGGGSCPFPCSGDGTGDGGPATSASLRYPRGIHFDAAGNLLIADSLDDRIRRVDAATGIITTIAGNGATGFSPDGTPATLAALARPSGVATMPSGKIVFTELDNHLLRVIE